MCGIAGITGANRSILQKMISTIDHRGPNARVVMDMPECDTALGHVRLSIIDLDERSNQPFVSECGRYVLVFNGEIYNYVELRAELEALGRVFRTASDTEVLLYWLIERGSSGLNALDGMFAFGLLDKHKRSLLIARDQIGEKPCYYSFFKGTDGHRSFAFASEIKAIRSIDGVDLSLDADALSDYIRFLYTAAPNTLYQGIKELPPGCFMEVLIDQPSENPIRYYNIESYLVPDGDIGLHEAVEAFRESLIKSISRRLRSDVPIGVYLSGGLDSNAILGVVRLLNPDQDLETFTVKYAGSKQSSHFDESDFAAAASRHHGVRNQQLVFTEHDQFMDSVNRITELFSQPFGNGTAIVSDKIASLISQRCKVGLVGDGGDEILVGYPRYKALNLYRKLDFMPRYLKMGLASCFSVLPETGRASTKVRRMKQFTRGLIKPMSTSFLEWSTYCDTHTLSKQIGLNGDTSFYRDQLALFERYKEDPIRGASIVDLTSFVPYNLMQSADRTSMAHALELRCPFLSTELIHCSLNIPTRHKVRKGRTKPLLVDALPNEMPDFIKSQPKRPFNPPMQAYLQRHLPSLESHLTGSESQIKHFIPEKYVSREIDIFRTGQRDNSTFLFGLSTLEAWLKNGSRVGV